jgi:hypothetical protein
VLRVHQIDPKVRAARKLLNLDLKRRWINEMPANQRAMLDVCALLDPRFKTYNFPGLASSTNLDVERAGAISLLRRIWAQDWKPAAPPAPPASVPAARAPEAAARAPTSGQPPSSFFDAPLAPEEPLEELDSEDSETDDELERYLVLHVEKNLDVDVLAW